MRNVIYGVGISLDGYLARPNAAVDFLFMPKDYSMKPFLDSIDTAVVGRKTYEVAQSMGSGPPGSNMATYVYSRTLPPGETKGATVVNRPIPDFLADLRRQQGKNIWLMGGGALARAFLEADLVDELYLGVVPTLIGAGIPAFPSGFPDRAFELTRNESFSRGLIALTYRRAR